MSQMQQGISNHYRLLYIGNYSKSPLILGFVNVYTYKLAPMLAYLNIRFCPILVFSSLVQHLRTLKFCVSVPSPTDHF